MVYKDLFRHSYTHLLDELYEIRHNQASIGLDNGLSHIQR